MEEFLNADLPCLLVNGDTGAPTMELPERLPKNKWFYMLKVNPDDPIPEKGFEKSVTKMAENDLKTGFLSEKTGFLTRKLVFFT